MYEQVLGQRDDFALIMLWLEPPEEEDDEKFESELEKLRKKEDTKDRARRLLLAYKRTADARRSPAKI